MIRRNYSSRPNDGKSIFHCLVKNAEILHAYATRHQESGLLELVHRLCRYCVVVGQLYNVIKGVKKPGQPTSLVRVASLLSLTPDALLVRARAVGFPRAWYARQHLSLNRLLRSNRVLWQIVNDLRHEARRCGAPSLAWPAIKI